MNSGCKNKSEQTCGRGFRFYNALEIPLAVKPVKPLLDSSVSGRIGDPVASGTIKAAVHRFCSSCAHSIGVCGVNCRYAHI